MQKPASGERSRAQAIPKYAYVLLLVVVGGGGELLAIRVFAPGGYGSMSAIGRNNYAPGE